MDETEAREDAERRILRPYILDPFAMVTLTPFYAAGVRWWWMAICHVLQLLSLACWLLYFYETHPKHEDGCCYTSHVKHYNWGSCDNSKSKINQQPLTPIGVRQECSKYSAWDIVVLICGSAFTGAWLILYAIIVEIEWFKIVHITGSKLLGEYYNLHFSFQNQTYINPYIPQYSS